jgi:hypothetical protein
MIVFYDLFNLRNPNVMTKLKSSGETEKPVFKTMTRRADYARLDKRLYSKIEDEPASPAKNLDESISSKIAPLKL